MTDKVPHGFVPPMLAVAPYGVKNASTRERIERWTSRLGIRPERCYYVGAVDARPSTLIAHPWRTIAAERRLRERYKGRVDLLFLHREATPLSRGVLEVRLLETAIRSVYDLDDALYQDTAGGSIRRWFRAPDKFKAIVERADTVIVGNATLADWASGYCTSVHLIPTCVEPHDYLQKVDYKVRDPPVIGWVGTRLGVRLLERLAQPLRAVHETVGARLEILGAPGQPPGQLADFSTVIPWSLATVGEQLATWDVGVMPLPDEPYTRGKCAYKLLQYCAAGVPSVASPVGVNREIMEAIGLPAPEADNSWTEAILNVLTMSTSDRASVGNRSRAFAKTYSFDHWEDAWLRALLDPTADRDTAPEVLNDR